MFAWCFQQPNYCFIYFQYLNGWWKLCFRGQKKLKQIFSWASIPLEWLLVTYLNHQKSIWRVAGDDCLVFPAKPLLYLLSIYYWLVVNHFLEIKKPKTNVLISFHDITIIAGYTFQPPKINMWSDYWWLFCISSQIIIISTFNYLIQNLFWKWERYQTLLFMSFDSIRILAGYLLNHQK